MPEHFHLLVVGAGPAGEKGAVLAAYFGKSVCLVERAPKPGGNTVNTGGVPSKTLRETASYFAGLRPRGLYGVEYRVKPDIAIGDFMYRERAVVEAAWQQVGDNLARHGVTTVQGRARVIDAHTVEVTRFREEVHHLTADVILIATGSHPVRPAGIPFDGETVVDSDTVLWLEAIPARLVVVGGGVIGCEYACTFAALGSRVTLVNPRDRLLTQLDAEVSHALCAEMTRRLGVQVMHDAEVRDVRVATDRNRIATAVLADGTELDADCVLYANGRDGATEGLGLEAAGVRVNSRGFIPVDEHYRTSVPSIFAAGDVIGFPALASTSMEQARAAVRHAFDVRDRQRDAPALPYGVWTVPEVAMVGETEETARAKGLSYEIGRASFRLNMRGQIIGDLDGFVKLVFRCDDQRLLGCSIVGEGACELIHLAAAVMGFEGSIEYFSQAVFNHPSLSAAYRTAAHDGLQRLARRIGAGGGLPRVGG